jgi:hypothetical protein
VVTSGIISSQAGQGKEPETTMPAPNLIGDYKTEGARVVLGQDRQ